MHPRQISKWMKLNNYILSGIIELCFVQFLSDYLVIEFALPLCGCVIYNHLMHEFRPKKSHVVEFYCNDLTLM